MKQRIEIAAVPTVADLRARRLELTRASLREMLVAGELDGYRVVVESLAGEFDVMDVAAAAVKLAHADEAADAQEIPSSAPRDDRDNKREEGRGKKGPPRGERKERDFDRSDKGKGSKEKGPRRKKDVPWEIAKLYIGAGRKAGVRPADIVGAIANEVGVDSSAVGAIEIADRFTLVEVPEEIAEEIIAALKATTIKGKRVPVRRDDGQERG